MYHTMVKFYEEVNLSHKASVYHTMVKFYVVS